MLDRDEDLPGAEGRPELFYQWFAPEEVRTLRVYPRLLEDRLTSLPESVEHVVRVEPSEQESRPLQSC